MNSHWTLERFHASVCPSRSHCHTCRKDRGWRETFNLPDPDFACPLGYAIGEKVTVMRFPHLIVRTKPGCNRPGCA